MGSLNHFHHPQCFPCHLVTWISRYPPSCIALEPSIGGDVGWRLPGNQSLSDQYKVKLGPGWSVGQIFPASVAPEESYDVTLEADIWGNYSGGTWSLTLQDLKDQTNLTFWGFFPCKVSNLLNQVQNLPFPTLNLIYNIAVVSKEFNSHLHALFVLGFRKQVLRIFHEPHLVFFKVNI